MRDETYTAIHEAGHAVVGLLLGCPLEVAAIEPDSEAGSAGHAVHWHGDQYADRGGEDWNLMVRAVTSYAGHMATCRLVGSDEDYEVAGAANDYRYAIFALNSIAGPSQNRQNELESAALLLARTIVALAWGQIELIAGFLQEQRTLTSKEVEEFLKL